MGGSTNALGQIRAAHKAGYECINIVEKGMHAWSRKSKYCKGYIGPHPYNEKENCIKFLFDIISKAHVDFSVAPSDQPQQHIGSISLGQRDKS